MWARVTTVVMEVSRAQEAKAHIDEKIIPALKGMDGFQAAYWMLDDASGKALNVALWADEEAVRASDEQVAALRKTAQAVGARVESIDVYRVTNQA